MFYHPVPHRLVLAFQKSNVKLWDAVTNLPFHSHAQKNFSGGKVTVQSYGFPMWRGQIALLFLPPPVSNLQYRVKCGKDGKSNAKGKQGLLSRDTQS